MSIPPASTPAALFPGRRNVCLSRPCRSGLLISMTRASIARNIPLQKRAKHFCGFLENSSHVVMGQLFDMFGRVHDIEKQINPALMQLRHLGPPPFGPPSITTV